MSNGDGRHSLKEGEDDVVEVLEVSLFSRVERLRRRRSSSSSSWEACEEFTDSERRSRLDVLVHDDGLSSKSRWTVEEGCSKVEEVEGPVDWPIWEATRRENLSSDRR